MRKVYVQPDAEILKLSSLIEDFLSLSMDDPESDEEEDKEDNGMDDSDAEIVSSIPSFW